MSDTTRTRGELPDDARAGEDAAHEADTLTFTVDKPDEGARLDAYLSARVGHVSRTRLKQLIEDGDVLVGGRVAKPSHKLKAGETVELETPEPPPVNFAPEDIPLDIVYEDDSIIVVNKPAGLVVHPAAGVPAGTLANAIAFRLQREAQPPDPQPPTPNPQLLRPGIVHRLDKDTSGLIVVAKTEAARENLMEQFRAREVVKYYVALVHGATREERGKIEEPVARDPRNRTRMGVVRGGRHALTLWRASRRFVRFTLLDVEIKTGRTHQIRVHLAWNKHPVVGDKVYGAGRDNQIANQRVRAAVAKLDRQFLHAERLGFRHPRTGEFLKFRAPLPEDLAAVLGVLEAAEGA
ncbi:MAG: RluA family pseudouridine synthase [Pyrinomonadaceae bacterium]